MFSLLFDSYCAQIVAPSQTYRIKAETRNKMQFGHLCDEKSRLQ